MGTAEEKLEYVLDEIRAAVMEFEYYAEYDSVSAFRRGIKILTQLVESDSKNSADTEGDD